MGTREGPEWPYPPGPRRRRNATSADLPGSPDQPFVERLQLKHAPMARVLDWLGMATALLCLLRQALHPVAGALPHMGRLHLGLFGCACASRILRRSPSGPDAPWALLRVLALLHGAWILQWQVAGAMPPASAAPPSAHSSPLAALISGEGHAALLLALCSCLPILHLKLSYPWHLGLSAAAQTAFMLYCLQLAPLVCVSAPMAAPPARRLTHQLARLLAPASMLSLHPLGLAPPASDGAAECCAVLRFSHLTLGLLTPLALQASARAALFRRHKRQRREAGLPPEQGFYAELHAMLHALLHPAVRPRLWVCGLLTLGLCWTVAVGSCAPGANS